MDSRRNFLGTVASAGVVTLASPARVLGANDRIRLGVIGVGDRGTQIAREASACPNTEVAAIADVYARRLEDAKAFAPAAKVFSDPRHLFDDRNIDAVLIATPHHLHCEHFTAALDAGKHCYQEKTMAFTVEHAKRMRAAYRHAGNRVVQIGHQSCSSGHVADASEFLRDDRLGRITAIRMHMFRNTPHGKPQWSRPVYPDMTAGNIQWTRFLGESSRREFDAHRFQNWRLFEEYSGGNVYENMCHQFAFWYKVMNLAIPKQVTMTGGIFLWKDGRDVPDTMHVSAVQPEELLISWDSGFGNNSPGATEDVLGTDGTISRGQQIRYSPQKVNRPDGSDAVGETRTSPRAHMQNFLNSIRGTEKPNCPFDVGFRVSVACRMAVESYRLGRTVAWDPVREEIVSS